MVAAFVGLVDDVLDRPVSREISDHVAEAVLMPQLALAILAFLDIEELPADDESSAVGPFGFSDILPGEVELCVATLACPLLATVGLLVSSLVTGLGPVGLGLAARAGSTPALGVRNCPRWRSEQ